MSPANSTNVPAAAYARLGRVAEAGTALRELLAKRPDFAVYGPEFYRRFLLPELADHLLDGLRKAGLEIAGPGAKPATVVVPPSANLSTGPDRE